MVQLRTVSKREKILFPAVLVPSCWWRCCRRTPPRCWGCVLLRQPDAREGVVGASEPVQNGLIYTSPSSPGCRWARSWRRISSAAADAGHSGAGCDCVPGLGRRQY
ncbi:hypothetical protein KCP71_09305 [Salmonella enterica subsp. enterica]|nr:hypothetical protein KCP71_09305 [Salmonella enterica subsp. enterica]